MYYLLVTQAGNDKDARIYGQPDVITELNLDFGLGVLQSTSIPPINVVINKDEQGKLTDNLIAEGTTGLVVNAKIRNLLAELGVDNIQYYDAKIVNSVTGEVNDDYKVANVIGVINCIDYDNSELEFFPDGGVMFFDKLVLDEGKIRGLLMFRLYDFLPIIVVHEKIKKIFEENSITGVRFFLPEEYVI